MVWEWLENTTRVISYMKSIIRGLESGYIIVDVDRVVMVDIEEWLEGYKQAVGDEE